MGKDRAREALSFLLGSKSFVAKLEHERGMGWRMEKEKRVGKSVRKGPGEKVQSEEGGFSRPSTNHSLSHRSIFCYELQCMTGLSHHFYSNYSNCSSGSYYGRC